MERHLAWLVALIMVLMTWLVLLCCGATAKKKARAHPHDTGSQPQEFTGATSSNMNERPCGTEPCTDDQLSEICACGESCHDGRLKEATSNDAAETRISIQGMDVVITIQDVCAPIQGAAKQDCESAGTLQDVKVHGQVQYGATSVDVSIGKSDERPGDGRQRQEASQGSAVTNGASSS